MSVNKVLLFAVAKLFIDQNNIWSRPKTSFASIKIIKHIANLKEVICPTKSSAYNIYLSIKQSPSAHIWV